MAYAAEIADALTEGLNAHAFAAPFATVTATRRYVPDLEAAELGQLQISVVPGSVTTEKTARGSDLFTHTVHVVIARQTDGSSADLDELATLADQILDAIRSEILTMPNLPPAARYLAAEMETSLDRDALTDRRIFLAQIQATYHVPRPKLEPGAAP